MSFPRDPAKSALRISLGSARASLAPEDRREQSEKLRRSIVEHMRHALPTHRRGTREHDAVGTGSPIIAAYLGVPPEPDTAPILEELHGLGLRIVLPVCEPDYRLSWAFWGPGDVLRRSVRAPVDEPAGPRHAFADLPNVALMLVPALGIDETGNRVGQGGGYYDRLLAQHPIDEAGAVPRLAVVYRSELLPAGAVPVEPWDQRVSGAFTPDGLFRVPSE
jgi:5-formyltetrahydrofolate cyclo-ligase